ncbi:MAG: hypothetical protein ABIB71_06365, partial [Candidatus Woesearchaeota archaeon]
NEKCVEGMIINMNSNKKALTPKEEAKISLTIDNPFNQKVEVDAVVKISSGVGISSVISGDNCGGSQCTAKAELPEKGHKELTFTLLGNEVGEVSLEAVITYNVGGKKIEAAKDVKVKFTECGLEDCTPTIKEESFLDRKVSIAGKEFSLVVLIGIFSIIVLIIVGVMIWVVPRK